MFYFCAGEMAERSNAAVLKTVDCHRSGGSNPSLSARQYQNPRIIVGFFVFRTSEACFCEFGEQKTCGEAAWVLILSEAPPKRDHEIIPGSSKAKMKNTMGEPSITFHCFHLTIKCMSYLTGSISKTIVVLAGTSNFC